MEKDYLKKVVTCIFATPMPLKFKIEELPDEQKPDSHTLQGLYSGTLSCQFNYVVGFRL